MHGCFGSKQREFDSPHPDVRDNWCEEESNPLVLDTRDTRSVTGAPDMENNDRTIFEVMVDENADAWARNIDEAMEGFAEIAERGGVVWSITDGKETFVNLRVLNNFAQLYAESAKAALADKNLGASDTYAQVAYTLVALAKTSTKRAG